MLLQACLRLEVDAVHKEIRCVRPILPAGVHELSIRGLWVDSSRTDVLFTRDAHGTRVGLLPNERDDIRLRVLNE